MRMSLNELPYFDGNPKDWPAFDKAFRETTEKGGFTNLQNMNRLQKCLKGNALKSVRALFLNPDNVNIIIARLKIQFGRPEQIYQELLRDVQKKANPNRIPEMSDALDNLVVNILTMNEPTYLYDHRLINELVCKLPEDKQIQWIKKKGEITLSGVMATLEHFNSWLATIAHDIRLLPVFSARSSFFHAGFTKIFTETVFSFLHDLFVRNERNISTQEGWLSKGSRKTTFFAHDDKTQIASRSV